VGVVRALGGSGAQVGLVHNHLPAPQIPVTETEPDIAAARAEYRRTNQALMAPLFFGAYPPEMLNQPDAPIVETGDLELISQPTDYFGVNPYAGDFVRAGRDGNPEVLPFPDLYPTGHLPWLRVSPQCLYWAIRHAAEVFRARTFYISENGAAFPDDVTSDGEILDLARREYLREHLVSLHRAVDEGYDVRGYFLWSFMDNFEWAEGYDKRFGIVHVDYATQKRTPKLSASWYANVMRENRVV
jgi:beta-glucosidase